MADVARRGINPRLGMLIHSSRPLRILCLANVVLTANDFYKQAKLVPLLQSEADYAFTQEIDSNLKADQWTPFPAAQLFANIMHRVTSRILIGPELCRDEAYLKASQSLGDSIFINGLVMSMLPPFPGPVRKLLKRTLSIFHKRVLRRAVNVVLPTVQRRFDEFEAVHSDGNNTEGEDVHLDAIQWTLSLTKSTYTKEHNPERIALSLLHNLWAGSAAPGGTVTQMVYQVLLEPDYLAPLRTEAEQALALHGGYTERGLNNMPLLDSFIRELNRLYPTGAVTCARTVMDPDGYQFSDGLRLPVGTRVAFPALAIQTDPENYQDPLRFDGWRFARLRNQPSVGASSAGAEHGLKDEEHRYAASTVSETYLPFGIGRHSCPGRFYGIRMIKLLFTKLVLEYDIKWDREVGKGRPASLSLNGQFAPNQGQKIWLRRRA